MNTSYFILYSYKISEYKSKKWLKRQLNLGRHLKWKNMTIGHTHMKRQRTWTFIFGQCFGNIEDEGEIGHEMEAINA